MGIDGVLLLKLMLEQRPDFKIIANFLLHRIAPLKPFIMPVNPFESHKDAKSSVAGFKAALQHLKGAREVLSKFCTRRRCRFQQDKGDYA